MPDWLAIIILGIIEGITEFLPISSTGHLLVVQRWLPRQSDLFNVVIQCGAVVAVIPLFPDRWRQMTTGWNDPVGRDYLLKVLVAFTITGVGGLILEEAGMKLPEKVSTVALALFIGGAMFLVIEFWIRRRPQTNQITWLIVAAVGLGQLIAAIFPGVSRSGATILLALLLGLNRPAATEFSFLVGIPTMLAAGGLKIFKELSNPSTPGPAENWGLLLLGTLMSAVVSFIAVKWLLRYVQSHTFEGFGWYRIALGLVLLTMITG